MNIDVAIWGLLAIAVLVSILAALIRRTDRNTLEANHSSRMELVKLCNLALGDGEYAFNVDYSQVLFVNQAEDTVCHIRRKGRKHVRAYVQSFQILDVLLSADPIKRLQAPHTIPDASLPQTSLCVRCRKPASDLYFLFGDEAAANEWRSRLQRVAANADSGHSTMKSTF